MNIWYDTFVIELTTAQAEESATCSVVMYSVYKVVVVICKHNQRQ